MRKEFIVLALAVVLLFLPIGIRALNHQPLIAGSESYYHARMAELVQQRAATDPLLAHRAVPFTPYHVLLALAKFVFPWPFASLLLSLALGLSGVWFLFLCARVYRVPHAFFVLLAFVLSPFFVANFSQATPGALLLPLFLATLLAAALPGARWTVITVVLVLAQAVSSPAAALFGLVAPYCAARVFPRFRKRAGIAVACGALAFLFFGLPRWFSLASNLPAGPKGILLIADFGNPFGFSIFALLLAALGFVLVWAHKRQHPILYGIALLTLALAAFFPGAAAYAAVVVAGLAGIAFGTLARMRWRLGEIKTLTVFVLVCGLLFSTLAVTFDVARGMPSAEFVEAAGWLREQPPGTVLSHPANGHWVTFFARKPILLDDAQEAVPDAEARRADLALVFSTVEPEVARRVLTTYGVRYVLVTREMRQGLVWEHPEQGLLFLLENSETFKKRFHDDIVDIWVYEP